MVCRLQMDDSNDVMATGEKDSNKLTTIETKSPQAIQKVVNSATDTEQISVTAVDSEAATKGEEVNNNSSSLPTSQNSVTQEPVAVTTNATHQPSPNKDVQASVTSSKDDTNEETSVTTTIADVSNKSTEDYHLQSTNTSQLPTSLASVNTTSTPNTTTNAIITVPTSVQSGTTDIGTYNTCKAVSYAEEAIQLVSSSSSETHNITGASTSSNLVMNSASAGNSFSVGTVAAAYNLPNTVKPESSMLGKSKMASQDFDIPLHRPAVPVIGVSGYNANKVAAEMAKIDSFLASLAKGGASTNPVPNVNFTKSKKEIAAASKRTPVGSALGNIALSYGYSEEESSSSSSDESEDDRPATVRLTKPTAANAATAMDTQEVEQSMKKVAVSSDSSSSSSEDELG